MVSYLNFQWLLSAIGLLGRDSPAEPGVNVARQVIEQERRILFGVQHPWNNSDLSWIAVDDRVRGGSSVSHLTPLSSTQNAAVFSGTLDTKTLGGAGFASQSTKPVSSSSYPDSGSDGPATDQLHWDLSHYDGIELRLGRFDNKTYTLTMKDSVPDSKRSDGRERSSISWEATFKPSDIPKHGEEDPLVWLPWKKFHATFRGREKPDAAPLKLKHIRRFSLMMRSFFEKQEGDFHLEILWMAAIKTGGHRKNQEQAAEL